MAVLSGFTYNGIHSEDLGLYYLPTEEDRWFPDPEFEVYSSDIEWRHGGVYYDSKATIREFTLNCFFENIDIAKRQAIKAWLKRGTVGMLIFDEMPFVYWMVRPGKIPVGNWYYDQDTYSGTVVVTFEAYNPFGYLTRKYNSVQATDHSEDYCHLLDADDMPDDPTPDDISFEVYNPGTETCGLSIEIAGSTSNPIRFRNETNGTFCEFKSLPDNGQTLCIDGETGLVYTVLNNGMRISFNYHDKGVVRLEPNEGGSHIQYINGSASGGECVIELVGYQATNALKDAEIRIGANEMKIVTVNTANNRVYCEKVSSGSVSIPASGTCAIRNANSIVIEEYVNQEWTTPSTLDLDSIRVDYRPRLM